MRRSQYQQKLTSNLSPHTSQRRRLRRQMLTDPIADFLTRIRNANQAYKERVEIPNSRMKRALAEIMKSEGFLRNYDKVDDGKQGVLRLYLKYGPNKQKVLTGLKRISKPGLRV